MPDDALGAGITSRSAIGALGAFAPSTGNGWTL
jgi:hypothetical protein